MGDLSPIMSEFATAEDEAAYQLWLGAKVSASLADARPTVPHASVMAELDAIIDLAQEASPAR